MFLSVFSIYFLLYSYDFLSGSSETGYSWQHTLSKWRNLGFTSHYVVAVIVLLNWII